MVRGLDLRLCNKLSMFRNRVMMSEQVGFTPVDCHICRHGRWSTVGNMGHAGCGTFGGNRKNGRRFFLDKLSNG